MNNDNKISSIQRHIEFSNGNAKHHNTSFEAMTVSLDRAGADADRLLAILDGLEIAVPTWGVGTGGTRFARFVGPGEPRTILDKLDDCAVIQSLVRCCPRVSPHYPWDSHPDLSEVKARADAHGLGFDAINSNTFQDTPNGLSYKYGSLTHTDSEVRAQAVAHNIDCIGIGNALGAKSLTVWIGDGSNFPGQTDLFDAFERYLQSCRAIYAALPDDWTMFLEHKLYEPAFYSTVIADWGSSLLAAQELGPKALCLVDLGHHAPTVNVEQIVARLAHAKKLGGFHFNDSKYGDDDLDAGSIDPYRLFLVFNELVAAEKRPAWTTPTYMLDQSHNVTDPIESLMLSAEAVQRAAIAAHLVDREALSHFQEHNDPLMASRTLRDAFAIDSRPLIAEWRLRRGGALDPIAAYRESGYRQAVAEERPAIASSGGGIV